MDHAQHLPREFPWKTAAVVVGVVAALELVALIGIGATRLAAPVRAHAAAARAAVHPRIPKIPSHPLRPRAKLSLLVLNGNGISGAAGSEATTLQTLGYGASRSANAPRHDYARSMVLFVPGYLKEARRLGHDAHVGIVSVLDGLPKAQLRGSQLVVVLGGS